MKQMGKKWIVLSLAAGLFSGALTAQQGSMDWGNAQWIKLKGDPRPESPLSERSLTRRNHPVAQVKTFPAPLMRHEFSVTKAVKSAAAHVCGLGYFELYWNVDFKQSGIGNASCGNTQPVAKARVLPQNSSMTFVLTQCH